MTRYPTFSQRGLCPLQIDPLALRRLPVAPRYLRSQRLVDTGCTSQAQRAAQQAGRAGAGHFTTASSLT